MLRDLINPLDYGITPDDLKEKIAKQFRWAFDFDLSKGVERSRVDNINKDSDFKALCKYFPSTSYSLTFPLSPPLCLVYDTECYGIYAQSYMLLSNPLYHGTAL